MKIVETTRFDDVDEDEEYEYRGFNHALQDGNDTFLLRTYDDEPGRLYVIGPDRKPSKDTLRRLVDFLQAEMGATQICLFREKPGGYAEIDPESLRFKDA